MPKGMGKKFEFSNRGFGGTTHPWDQWLALGQKQAQFLVGSVNASGEEVDGADYVVGEAHKDNPKTKANQFAYVLKLQGWARGLEVKTQVHTDKDDDGSPTDIGIVYVVSVPTPERAEELKALAKERRKVKAKAKTAVNGDTEEEEYEEEDA